MENEIKSLIKVLRSENQTRSDKLNSGNCNDYTHTALVHQYNNTLEIIKRLEKIVK